MKMFALRGEKEMELPGDFFVDSMDVALPGAMGLRRDEDLLPPLVPGPVAFPAATGCVGGRHGDRGCKRGPQVPEGLRAPARGAGSGPAPCPGGTGAPRGGCGALARPDVLPRVGAAPAPSSSSSATGATFFGRISFGLTLKCPSRASKPEIKPKRAARPRTIGFCSTFDLLTISNRFSFQIESLLFNFFEAGNGKSPINWEK